MKLLIAVLAFVPALVVVAADLLPDEEHYDFRKVLEMKHQPNRRDASRQAKSTEFAFVDGAVIAIPADAPEELTVAAADFVDYLKVSMGVTASVGVGAQGAVVVVVDKDIGKGSMLKVGANGVWIGAADGRAAAQALFHLEDLMNLRRAPYLAFGKECRKPKFERRMFHSGWSTRDFPEGYLASAAHAGFNTILMYLSAPNREFGSKIDVNDLIVRAGRWGIDLYIYSSIPAMVHPDDPKAPEVFAKSYGAVAKAHPGVKGFLIVPESCYFPSRDPRTSLKGEKGKFNPSRFPCTDYPKWLSCIEKTVRAEIPDVDFVFWTYNFYWTPWEDRKLFINNVSTSMVLNVSFALGGDTHLKRNGLAAKADDYTIGYAGPSSLFRQEAAEIKARGHRLFTTCNTGGRTWDFGTCPYEPFPQQWKVRFDALDAARAEYGLSGLIETHHYGWMPNIVSELAKEAFTEGGIPFDKHLRAIAARDFGEANVDKVISVWQDWSVAIRDYVASAQNQWGPFRIGPAYPFNFFGETIQKGEFPGYDSLICNVNYGWSIPWRKNEKAMPQRLDVKRHAQEVELCRGAGSAFVVAAKRLEAIAVKIPDAPRRMAAIKEAGIGEYVGRAFLTMANVKEAAICVQDYERSTDEVVRAKLKARVTALAKDEYASTLEARRLVMKDSRLGFEPRMKYYGGVEQIDWKLRRLEQLYELCK